jgi:hypothetical protein
LKAVFESYLDEIVAALQNYEVVNLYKDKVTPLL